MLVLLACTLVRPYLVSSAFLFGLSGQWPIDTVLAVSMVIFLLLAYLLFKLIQQNRKLQATNSSLSSRLKVWQQHQLETTEKLKALEKVNFQMVELDHFKQGFTQMIAHDMKNSLNAIIGFSGGQLSSQKQQYINQSGEYLLNMVHNMLDAQRMKEAKVPLQKHPYFLDELLKEALQRLNYQLESKAIHVENQLRHNLIVYVDKELLTRVFGNLLANAIRYSPPNSTVEITSKTLPCKNRVQVSITDYGEGVLKEYQQHLFEKYWQLSAADSGVQASTGLGLAFSKLAVEAHQGEIGVESEYGKQTTLYFTLPLEQGEREGDPATGTVNNPNPELITDEDLPLLLEYGERLSQVQVHEFSKVNRIVKEMEKAGVKSEWLKQLMVAVHQGDQVRFEELICLLR